MLGTIFERCVETSPIAVLVRGLLERVLGAEPLDAWDERPAPQQDTRALFFATVYPRLRPGVLRRQPSGHAAYRQHEDTVASLWFRSRTNSLVWRRTRQRHWDGTAPPA